MDFAVFGAKKTKPILKKEYRTQNIGDRMKKQFIPQGAKMPAGGRKPETRNIDGQMNRICCVFGFIGPFDSAIMAQ